MNSPVSRLGDWLLAGCLAFSGVAALLVEGPERDRALGTVACVVSLFSAYLVFRVRRIGRRLAAMEELLEDVRFGPGTKRDRDAVDILVQALRVPDAAARATALRTLRKISGIDLGEEAAPWEEWWSVARSTFVRPGAGAGPKK